MLGGVVVLPDGALPVVTGAGLGLLAVLLPVLLQPPMMMNAINASTAMPAIQPHMPPLLSLRRTTGSLRRGSLSRGSVKRGSDMPSSFGFQTLFGASVWETVARVPGSDFACESQVWNSNGTGRNML